MIHKTNLTKNILNSVCLCPGGNIKQLTGVCSAGKYPLCRKENIASARPYGYTIVRRARKERTLEIVPEEAEIVRMIYDKFVREKWNASQIARYLTKMGIPYIQRQQRMGPCRC